MPDRGERDRDDEVVEGRAQEIVERRIAASALGEQRAGIEQYIDEDEQSDQQRDRAPPVRLDVRVETEGGFICSHSRN